MGLTLTVLGLIAATAISEHALPGGGEELMLPERSEPVEDGLEATGFAMTTRSIPFTSIANNIQKSD